MKHGVRSLFGSFSIYFRKRIYICGALAFSSGFSVLFLMCTIPLWLRDFGITKTVIGWFSLTYLPYVLKIFWAPFMDVFNVPFFGKKLGHLRGWAFVTQASLLLFVLLLSFINPLDHLTLVASVTVIIAFCSASRDIVTDAYRVEILDSEEVAPGSAIYLLGYRIGMLVASAGSLFLADYLPWSMVFHMLCGFLFVGLIVILFIPEPKVAYKEHKGSSVGEHLAFVKSFGIRLIKATKMPLKEFFDRKSWLLIILLIPFYKLGDNFVSNMSNFFFLEIGFLKTEIAKTVKLFGLIASIIGSLWGGIIVNRLGDLKAMFLNGIIHMLAFGAYVVQAYVGDSIYMLYFTIAITHVTAGIVTTAIVSYISNLCHPSYRVTQYAFFSSVRSLDKCLAFPAGMLADTLMWSTYFMIVPFFSLSALILILYLLVKKVPVKAALQDSIVSPDPSLIGSTR